MLVIFLAARFAERKVAFHAFTQRVRILKIGNTAHILVCITLLFGVHAHWQLRRQLSSIFEPITLHVVY